jgi:hypothetical protein
MFLFPSEQRAKEKHHSIPCKKFFKTRCCASKCRWGKKFRISKEAVYDTREQWPGGRWLSQLKFICPRMNKEFADIFQITMDENIKTIEEIKVLYED